MCHFKTYEDLLKTPEWRDKRLEILYRDNFTCQRCGKVSDHNHVHHVIYIYGRDPWNYPGQYLMTLCDDCHALEHVIKDYFKAIINEMLLSGLLWDDIIKKIDLDFSIIKK